jgi:DNA-binding beta-propeller fold protein YncE
MRGRLRYALVAALTSAAALIGPGIGSAALGSPAGSGSARSGPGSVLWTSARAGEGHDIAAGPRGGKVFAVGSTGLVAYAAGTGAKLWDNTGAFGLRVAVSPDGRIVFVIKSVRASGGADISTAAFDAATGKQLWARRYNGRANGDDRPTALAVSPGGGAVFVTGTSKGRTSGLDYATVAYAAASGRQLWVSRYNRHGRGADFPQAIAVNPRGGAVYVTGYSLGRAGEDFATVAYAAASGASLWTRRYGRPDRLNAANSVAVSPDGRRVFVTGGSKRRGFGVGFATVAYAAGTGTQLWARRYHGPADRDDSPGVVLVSPRGGGTVIVAGESTGSTGDYLCVSYSAVTGRTRWVSRFVDDGFTKEFLGGAAVSPDGRSFYLTGFAFVVPGGEEPSQVLTVAAKVATGAQTWSQVVTTDLPDQVGGPVAVSPDGGTVYIGLEDFIDAGPQEFTTVAFRA